MFTVNLDFDNDGHFYADNADAEETITVNAGLATEKKAKWNIPDGIVRINIYRLMEHPSFQQLLEARLKFIKNFQLAKSDESKSALEEFMKNTVEILKDVLSIAHRQYWKDSAAKLRSPYSFNECISTGINAGVEKLQILNMITDIKLSSGISSTIINGQMDDILRKNIKSLGLKEDKLMSKKGRKPK